MLGSIFSNRLTYELAASLPASAVKSVSGGASANPAALDKLPASIHTAYVTAFTNALSTVFVVAAGVAAFAFLLSWMLEQRPLRDTVAGGSGVGESFAVPKHTDSLAEASRALTALVGRHGRRRMIERLTERAGVDLSPAAAWLIVRLHENPAADLEGLSVAFDVPSDVAHRALDELEARELVTNGASPRMVTPAGEDTAQRLIDERHATLTRLCSHWEPDVHPDLAAVLRHLAQEFAAELHPERVSHSR